ncbi:DUF4382 domain-containing protein [Ferruginibacter sp. SUN002]|uniref:DUF4382 domain-containing protein n=1 Tax=Ferruginibacter sp. SUN002 TaxID=2937789 RepID=UPI003D35E9EC
MKSTKTTLVGLGLSLFLVMLIFSACKKDTAGSSGAQHLSLYLTDDPAPIVFDSVLIDIQRVEVKLDSSEEHENDDDFGDNDHDGDDDHQDNDAFGYWVDLSMTPGLYNVSALRNGVDALLASGTIQGDVRKIRVSLGAGSVVYVGGVAHTLSLAPGVDNYLYVKIHDEDEQGGDNENDGDNENEEDDTPVNIWLDFDLGRSITLDGGQYYLTPVVKPFCDENSGSVEGKVRPVDAKALITIFNATDTATAIPEYDDDGEYKIRGLNEGTYSITFKAFNGYKDTTVNNVVVLKGVETQVEPVTLYK